MKSLCSFFVMLFLSACLYVETFLGLIRNKLRGYLFTGGRKVKRRKLTGLVIVQLIIGTLVLFGSIYSSVTENFSLQPLVFILLSAWLIIIGVKEYKRTKKLGWGILYFGNSLFVFYVGVEGILMK